MSHLGFCADHVLFLFLKCVWTENVAWRSACLACTQPRLWWPVQHALVWFHNPCTWGEEEAGESSLMHGEFEASLRLPSP